MKLKQACIHCGEIRSNASFLLGQAELVEHCMTGGYTCFPICVGCIEDGKCVVTSGRKNELKAREEWERKSKKLI